MPVPVGQRRTIALFVVVSLVSGFGGTAMSLVAGIWVMALTDSASLAAMAGFCVFFPTLFGPLLGALVDRLPRRPLLVWTNLVVAASLLLLLAVRSADQVWLLYVVMLGYGISYVLLDAAEAAWLPAALPGDALGRVDGLRMRRRRRRFGGAGVSRRRRRGRSRRPRTAGPACPGWRGRRGGPRSRGPARRCAW
ncbi:hypothetical protein ACSNN9_09955 [Micromonospora sp. URMC 107]|uniref:hypothetical protein n=1 Tax=Micromonospora sp. URMC 107 TaxID=3423418 RepID=UPI003F194B73